MLRPPAPRGRIPLYIGGFAEKAMNRVARYGEGYIGSPDVCDLYAAKLAEQGKDITAARIRVTGLTTVVARDPDAAMDELAPYFLHVNNTYGEFFAEDQALGMAGMKQKTLEEYKASGELQILTPDAAIAMFKDMQVRMPIEHFMMAMPPGLPAARFLRYAEDFAKDVLPAFA
jgi:alkanesulfonate monooxygenase SsuD/methylene tetrahydromethanopterin reductase-like flavin-dependent oxidoreductase (luciferase family)